MPITWNGETYYSVREVADIFQRDRSTILHDIGKGRLEALKVRGQWYVRKDVIDAQFRPVVKGEQLRSTRQQRRAAAAAAERLESRGYKV